MSLRITTWTDLQYGGTYAVEIDEQDSVVRAAGPLHHGDSRDPDSLRGWIDNNFDASGDGAWVQARRRLGHFGSLVYSLLDCDHCDKCAAWAVGWHAWWAGGSRH